MLERKKIHLEKHTGGQPYNKLKHKTNRQKQRFQIAGRRANQLAIYKPDGEVELRATEKKKR